MNCEWIFVDKHVTLCDDKIFKFMCSIYCIRDAITFPFVRRFITIKKEELYSQKHRQNEN